MPRQALLRIIKAWHRLEPKDSSRFVPLNTRGFYVLYTRSGAEEYKVTYIGVGGLSATGGGGIRSRLKSHAKNKSGWTHFSLFEVHDNVTSEDIRELESLLLGIFRHDPRIQLSNKQVGSSKLRKLRKPLSKA